MVRAVICPKTAEFFKDDPVKDHLVITAVLFRGRVYVAAPRHMDAINLAFAGMSDHQKHRVANRIADGKEKMLFGTAHLDGTGWEWNEEYQDVRMTMYGFEPRYSHC